MSLIKLVLFNNLIDLYFPYFTFNIIQYNKESDGINLLYSSNNFLYNDISFNKEMFLDLFTSDEYGKYQQYTYLCPQDISDAP